MGASKIIIIPDLHGREFWRGAVNDLGEDTHVVFLGDYMDPYRMTGSFGATPFRWRQNSTLAKSDTFSPMPASIMTGLENIPPCSAPLRRLQPKRSTNLCSHRSSWTHLQRAPGDEEVTHRWAA